jgi:hypothetical protein
MTRRAEPRTAGPSTLAEYFRQGVETQEALAARCADEGWPVSQAHLSRIAAGDNCSLGLAKVISRLTGLPLESFGEAA